jgi:hypothetical protein
LGSGSGKFARADYFLFVKIVSVVTIVAMHLGLRENKHAILEY